MTSDCIIPPVDNPVLSPWREPGWLLCEEGLSPAREREIESLFAVSNGYFGVRASIGGVRFSRPATFVAGVYVEEKDLGPRLARLPEWLNVDVIVEDERLSPESGRVLTHRLQLDLRQGVLWREWRHQDPHGRVTRLTSFQLASLADRHVLLQSVMVTAENYAGTIGLATRLVPSEAWQSDVEPGVVEPGATLLRADHREIAVAAASETQSPGPAWRDGVTGGHEEQWSWKLALGQTIGLDRILAVFTFRDVARPMATACNHLASVRTGGFPAAVASHVDAWRRRWDSADVRIAGDEQAQRAIRFAVYHLISAANPADEYVSVAARGLTGDAYRGHVLWDTEIYLLPFWVFTDPPAARAMLMYRYHTLDAARRKARDHGCKGALYAWESADTGNEVTPRRVIFPDGRVVSVLTGEQEHHISADVAFAVWQYWRATGDNAFMAAAGTEILVETARFWESRVQPGPDGRAHIRQVIGPDEYHETIDDNAYTNAMAAFNLECAAVITAWLEQNRPHDWRRLSAHLGTTESERGRWRTVAAAIITGFNPATKLFEQFAGYFQLEDTDPGEWRDCTTPPDVCLGAERVRRSKIAKQADVVALSALQWQKWPAAVHEANFRYYEPRTAHGSSLSPAIHALVAARLGDVNLAQTYFHQAMEVDLANNMGNAAGGVHMATLGGLWQAAVFGAAGVQLGENGLKVDPHLLPSWTELAFPLQWRGRQLRLRFESNPQEIEIAVDTGSEFTIEVPGGPACRVSAGQRFVLHGNESGWGDWEEARQ